MSGCPRGTSRASLLAYGENEGQGQEWYLSIQWMRGFSSTVITAKETKSSLWWATLWCANCKLTLICSLKPDLLRQPSLKSVPVPFFYKKHWQHFFVKVFVIQRLTLNWFTPLISSLPLRHPLVFSSFPMISDGGCSSPHQRAPLARPYIPRIKGS